MIKDHRHRILAVALCALWAIPLNVEGLGQKDEEDTRGLAIDILPDKTQIRSGGLVIFKLRIRNDRRAGDILVPWIDVPPEGLAGLRLECVGPDGETSEAIQFESETRAALAHLIRLVPGQSKSLLISRSAYDRLDWFHGGGQYRVTAVFEIPESEDDAMEDAWSGEIRSRTIRIVVASRMPATSTWIWGAALALLGLGAFLFLKQRGVL